MVGLVEILVLIFNTQWAVALNLRAAYGTFRNEAERQERRIRDLLREQFRTVVRYKRLTYPAIGLLGLAIGTFYLSQVPHEWIRPLPIELQYFVAYSYSLSYVFIQMLVIYLGLQTLYALTSSLSPPALRRNRRLGALMIAASLVGSFVVAFGVSLGWLVTGLTSGLDLFNYGLAFGFTGIFFVTGLGGISVVENISRSVSSYTAAEKRRQLAYLFGPIAGLLATFIIASYIISYLSAPLALQLFSENEQLGVAVSLALVGSEVALPIGIAYFIYLMLKQKMQQAARLVYITLLVVLSFAYIGYQEKQFSTVPTGASLSLTLAQFVSLIVSVSLFAVGYIELMFAKPRSVERRARFREGALMASLTFLLLFVVVGYTWGLPISIQSYFYLRDYASFWGLIVGAIGGFALVFAKKSYSRISRRGIRTEAIPVSCAGCGMVLESLASFCSGCGSPVSGPDPIPEEKVVFKGAGRVLLRGTRHHSLTRKLVSLIAGGPLGFLFFGMDETRKLEADGELFVTPSFFRCGRSDYPFERVVGLGRTLPAPSVVLALKKGSGVEKQLGWGGLKGELRKLIAELTVRDHAALLGGLHKSVTEPRL